MAKITELLKLLPEGPISAWPDYVSWDDEFVDEGEWIVGVAYRDASDNTGYEVKPGDEKPWVWSTICVVEGGKVARVLADVLNEMRENMQNREES